MPKKKASKNSQRQAWSKNTDNVMAKVRTLRRTMIAKKAQNSSKGRTAQSLGLKNVKKEVVDMSPLRVVKQISNCIADVALSILSGKGVHCNNLSTA